MTTNQNNHAIVFGCSGINGWALVNQLLSGYPTTGTFAKVTAIANRPFKPEDAGWPRDAGDRLQIVSGIDLSAGDDIALKKALAGKISSVETVSHIYYAAYRESRDGAEECRLNKEMLRAAVQSIEDLSPALKFVTLVTGTKAYGVMMFDKFPFRGQTPLKESYPRIPDEYAKNLFYYHMVDLLHELSAGKAWSWCEVRPDIIIGVAPFGNANCIAQTTGIFLGLYRALEGPGARVAFPGTEAGWKLLSTDSNQDIIAQFCIHASLQPRDNVHAQTFNIGDDATPLSWEKRWPILASYFGLEGVGPSDDAVTGPEYVESHKEEFQALCKERGLKEDIMYTSIRNTGSRGSVMKLMDFDRNLDLSKARALGFNGELSTESSWYTAFDRVREAKLML
ncbi:uncharacterized protein N7496_005352 [Penicillium cataractarum]|uniref:PRISE-like Rossmann-fold domain-containing protein n=1 Tax=Penicillium cataractarum TaxID=2100454 RepID=A0A9W9SG19_9EURO|nr:uncharacterized protein N7496_005352 [Penicillium cataractarum]KAJ5377943.1 hypothetical protein N7496_005352 [Penicillium cataractarum]